MLESTSIWIIEWPVIRNIIATTKIGNHSQHVWWRFPATRATHDIVTIPLPGEEMRLLSASPSQCTGRNLVKKSAHYTKHPSDLGTGLVESMPQERRVGRSSKGRSGIWLQEQQSGETIETIYPIVLNVMLLKENEVQTPLPNVMMCHFPPAYSQLNPGLLKPSTTIPFAVQQRDEINA